MRNMQRTIVFIVATCCLARLTICDVDAAEEKSSTKSLPKIPNETGPNIEAAVEEKASKIKIVEPKTGSDVPTSKPKKPDNISATSERPTLSHPTSPNSGALLRGFYVFVGLSMIALAYMIFRNTRVNNKSRTQMVRKYGVLAHKQDIEMRPLPLDDDDDDDDTTTVFDATSMAPARPTF